MCLVQRVMLKKNPSPGRFFCFEHKYTLSASSQIPIPERPIAQPATYRSFNALSLSLTLSGSLPGAGVERLLCGSTTVLCGLEPK